MENDQNQNANQNQPNEPTGNVGYEQYLNQPSDPKKSKKKLIIIGLVAGVLLLIITVVAVALLSQDEDNQPKPAETVVCHDEECLNENFIKCQAVSYEVSDQSGSTSYEITGSGNVDESECQGRIVYKNQADFSASEFTCTLYNRDQEFVAALTSALTYPEDYDCVGELPQLESNQQE